MHSMFPLMQIVSEEAADPSLELHESGKSAVETLTFENHVPGESQQVKNEVVW